MGTEHAAVWRYGETLTIAFADEPLARYRVRSQPDTKHLRAVEEPPVYATPFRSPQLALWERDDTEWLKVIRRPDDAPATGAGNHRGRHRSPCSHARALYG